MDDLETRVQQTEQTLRDWCKDNGRRIAPDNSVSEEVAGELCTFAGGDALARRVDEGRSVPRYYTLGGRRRYRIRHIAEWLESLFGISTFGETGGV